MPVRKATPEETQAFWAKPVVIFGQKPTSNSEMNSSKSGSKRSLPQENEQDRHNEWLTNQSDKQLKNLVKNLKTVLQNRLKKESDEASQIDQPAESESSRDLKPLGFGMFKVPKGATVWAVDTTPVLKLKDGSLVFAGEPNRAFPSDVFRNNASRADAEDMAFWEKLYGSSKIVKVDRSVSN